jgi:hypothetical protein
MTYAYRRGVNENKMTTTDILCYLIRDYCIFLSIKQLPPPIKIFTFQENAYTKYVYLCVQLQGGPSFYIWVNMVHKIQSLHSE